MNPQKQITTNAPSIRYEGDLRPEQAGIMQKHAQAMQQMQQQNMMQQQQQQQGMMQPQMGQPFNNSPLELFPKAGLLKICPQLSHEYDSTILINSFLQYYISFLIYS